MKLFRCRLCKDVVAIKTAVWLSCSCRGSWGRYIIDEILATNIDTAETAEFTGGAMPFGIGNGELDIAMEHQGLFAGFFYGPVVPHNGHVVIRDIHILDMFKESVRDYKRLLEWAKSQGFVTRKELEFRLLEQSLITEAYLIGKGTWMERIQGVYDLLDWEK